jgi:hypothetical protein
MGIFFQMRQLFLRLHYPLTGKWDQPAGVNDRLPRVGERHNIENFTARLIQYLRGRDFQFISFLSLDRWTNDCVQPKVNGILEEDAGEIPGNDNEFRTLQT